MIATDARPVSYFGKLPSRGDFVQTVDSHQLMSLLDRWAGNGIELLARSPDWKRLYDAFGPMHFAFLGSRSRLAVAGHFHPSRDSAERRFPFLAATRLEVGKPLQFISRSPLAFARLWTGLARGSRLAVQAEDAREPLRDLAETRIAVSADPSVYDAPFDDFLDMQDMGSLQQLLRASGHESLHMQWTLPALGLLLQPLLTGAAAQVDKSLAFPLPRDGLYRPLVAAFWLDLLAGFTTRSDIEIAVLIRDDASQMPPEMIVGFHGADARLLQTVFDPQIAATQTIRVADAAWVTDQIPDDYALNKLASYIERDDLSLRMARTMFGQTFLGT